MLNVSAVLNLPQRLHNAREALATSVTIYGGFAIKSIIKTTRAAFYDSPSENLQLYKYLDTFVSCVDMMRLVAKHNVPTELRLEHEYQVARAQFIAPLLPWLLFSGKLSGKKPAQEGVL